MTWENILKRPMPIDTRSNRDEQHRQAIIDYEKRVIEPAFTEYTQGRAAGEKSPLKIHLVTDINRKDGIDFSGTFIIGRVTQKNLGSNSQFIANVIAELYKKEGYQVKGPEKYSDGTYLTITQP